MKKWLMNYGSQIKQIGSLLIVLILIIELGGIWKELRRVNKQLRSGVSVDGPVTVEVDNTPLDVQIDQ